MTTTNKGTEMTATDTIDFRIRTVLGRRAVVFVEGKATGPGAAEPYLENAKSEARRYRDAGLDVRLRWVEVSYTVSVDDDEILADLPDTTEVKYVDVGTFREVWTGEGYASRCDYVAA